MLWKPGQILRIKDYKFEDDGTTRDKYAIVLHTNDTEAYLIHCLTTSQNNLSVDSNNYGCSMHHNIPYFFIPKNRTIGDQDYYFEKDTFIFFSGNVRKEQYLKFQTAASKQVFGLTTLGFLKNEELTRLIKCALKSRFIPSDIESELRAAKDSL